VPKTDQIKQVLGRGVDSVYPSAAALETRLLNGPPLRVYLGIDPSGPELHLGHAIPLQKLRQFQELGHQVILLVGDFTGQTGDPTDKQAARVPLSKEAVLANAARYRDQAAGILEFAGDNPAEFRFNSEWLESLSFSDVADLAGHFTVQQMLERDMFEDRLKAGKPISLREFLYPLMQGYDSVALEVDLEIGATDQTFNMLAGRKLAKEYAGREKFVLTVPILADKQGVKLGKSEGNAVPITAPPTELFGQVMALPDEVIVQALAWCTSVPQAEVTAVEGLVATDPMAAKLRLAAAVVTEYHDAQAAAAAAAAFGNLHQEGGSATPEDWQPPRAPMTVAEVMKESGLVSSLSEARRKITEGAVKLNGTTATDPTQPVAAGTVVEFGKKRKRAIRVGG
jgi:tyrosyl-tRNA synthetase